MSRPRIQRYADAASSRAAGNGASGASRQSANKTALPVVSESLGGEPSVGAEPAGHVGAAVQVQDGPIGGCPGGNDPLRRDAAGIDGFDGYPLGSGDVEVEQGPALPDGLGAIVDSEAPHRLDEGAVLGAYGRVLHGCSTTLRQSAVRAATAA